MCVLVPTIVVEILQNQRLLCQAFGFDMLERWKYLDPNANVYFQNIFIYYKHNLKSRIQNTLTQWSKLTEFIVMNFDKSYLNGA